MKFLNHIYTLQKSDGSRGKYKIFEKLFKFQYLKRVKIKITFNIFIRMFFSKLLNYLFLYLLT